MKNNDLKNKNESKIIQVNPKLRLILLIFSSWFFSTFLFWFVPCVVLISYLQVHFYIPVVVFICFFLFLLFYRFYIMRVGVKYLLGNTFEIYVRKNNEQLKKIHNLKLTDIGQLFNVIPICNEVYTKKQNFKISEEFTELSWIEGCTNRLVVNGKLNNLDFSWGVVTRIKKRKFKVFLLAILYFGPIFGLFWGLFPQRMLNETFYQPDKGKGFNLDPLLFFEVLFAMFSWAGTASSPNLPLTFKYKKLGCWDLFPFNVGKLNSENYLIFSAKLKNPSDFITLIPKNDDHQLVNLDAQYEWPANISLTQKMALQKLMQEMPFLPSIYIYNDNISIIMKKYHYNEQDNRELQTWELIKNPEADSQIQFNYLNQAIKIYQIFNEKEE